ncbi:MAG TPA: aspartate aminotransferase family protein, partial [Armatimonadota bacterium]|nr:aspartate aminotransferase family protein [Armatimonadota bacterium]
RHVCQTSDSAMGLEVESARGATIRTRDGRSFVDLLAGIGVNNVGHAHPEVVAAVQAQAAKYLHAMVYGEYALEPQVRLAERLAGVAPGPLSVVYFTNSGTEANEGALKVAKKHTGRRKLVAFERSYHGDTHGSLSVTGRDVYRTPFLPLLPDVEFLPFGDVAALARIDETVAGVITEPIQGEAGVRVPPDEWLPALRRRCTEVGALLILDEVQTGMGRTGRMFACEHWGVTPDLLVLAKALGGGMPLGAFIGAPEVMACLSHDPPLAHVTTFGGHPVCCAAGLASLEVLLREGLPRRADGLGQRIRAELWAMGELHGGVRDVRGQGMLIGLELESAARTRDFAAYALEEGVILGWTLHSDTVVRLAPPLNIGDEELERGLRGMETALARSGGRS